MRQRAREVRRVKPDDESGRSRQRNGSPPSSTIGSCSPGSEKEVSSGRSQPRTVIRYGKQKAERKDEAMIARLDHRPRLTAALALSTAVLVVVVITLATLLITAQPPAATSSSESGANPSAAAAVPGTGENYGEGWNNYGCDAEHAAALRQAAMEGDGADSAIERHAEVVAAYRNRW